MGRVVWPWDEPDISFVWMASIAASIAVVWLAIAISGEAAAFAGVGLNTAVANLGAGVFLLKWSLEDGGASHLGVAAAVTFAAGVFGLVLFAWARRQPVRDPRTTPALVRGSFVAFALVLIPVGSALALKRDVFPWDLQPATSAMFGCYFLGAATYFAHPALQPHWALAAPLLWGFLAYDIVLIGPYLRLAAQGGGEGSVDDFYGASISMPSLSVFLVVISYSAALALYAMLVCRSTRVVRVAEARQAP